MKLLIIEDDKMVINAISFALQIGCPEAQLLQTEHGEEGLRLIEEASPDLVILDLGLPDISGFEVIRLARLFSDVPIIILTVKTDEPDIVQALELGANEYVTKPFRQLELLARIRSLTKRPSNKNKDTLLNWGPFKLDPLKNIAFCNQRKVLMTPTEVQILRELIVEAPRIVPYSKLSEAMVGNFFPDLVESIKVHIHHLRKKLEDDPSNPEYILNKPGKGYYLSK